MLQRRGRVTAGEVAEEFEVSERTARRDLDALGAAGLPVYPVVGRGGGWRLLGEGRTDLSGLSAQEVQALFAVMGPQGQATREVRSALRKLVGALPAPMRDPAEAAAASTVSDPVPWGSRWSRPAPPPRLELCRAAVIHRRELQIGYTDREGQVTNRVVQPLGLGDKAGRWYLFADTEAGRRSFRVDRMTTAAETGNAAQRDPAFDLDDAFREFVDRVEGTNREVLVRFQILESFVPTARYRLGERLALESSRAASISGPPPPDGVVEGRDGWVRATITGTNVLDLAADLAGLGHLVRVDAPQEVVERLAVLADELSALYRDVPRPLT